VKERSFSSKILLFGEYSVIKHSNALALPYSLFQGRLTFPTQNKGERDAELRALVSFIKKLDQQGQLNFSFDIDSFAFDVGQGLVFDSSIPQGYGVGSSGALVAAIYERYVTAKSENVKIEDLKKHFALLESHFHGSSSGFDPLVSYLNKPILKDRVAGLTCASLPEQGPSEGTIFLLNTGRSRKTEPLVNLFLEKCKISEFSKLCESQLAPVTNSCIEAFLSGNANSLWDSFFELSRFQFEHFSPMIPKLYHDVWEQGLESKDFLLKLCGAGGGGFLMGMTRDFRSCSNELKGFELRPIYRL
jgi:mevalonate kinase